jgi:hypothetical protein
MSLKVTVLESDPGVSADVARELPESLSGEHEPPSNDKVA